MTGEQSAASGATICHGVLVEVIGLGVWIAGRSGVGKSELALELIARGHRLIADDAIEFYLDEHGALCGRCPELLQGFLEVRGLGVLNLAQMYADAIGEARRIDLLLRLTADEDVGEGADRLFGRRGQQCLLGHSLPEVTLPIRVGHNLAVLTEAVCRDQKLRAAGYDAAEDFIRRQTRRLRS